MSVTFAQGDLPGGADVSIMTGVVDAEAPPAMVRPLSKPFDIAVKGVAHGGAVAIHYQPEPGDASASDLVMVIRDTSGWQILPTTVDNANHAMTARWPHFSLGFPAALDPGFHPSRVAGAIASGGKWVWGEVKDGYDWAKTAVSDIATTVAHAVLAGDLAIAGGTVDSVKCTPASTDWSVSGSIGMTGCVEPKDANGLWPLRVNDRYPYPLLVSLPSGAIGPGFFELPAGMSFTDKLLTMIALWFDHEIIPAGQTALLKLTSGAGASVSVGGSMDPFSIAIRDVMVLAAYYSGGRSAEAEAAVAAEADALEARFLAARQARSTEYTLAEYIRDTQSDNSPLRLRQRALARANSAHDINVLFDVIDLGECGWALLKDISTAGKNGLRDAVGKAEDEVFDKCWPTFAVSLTRDTAGAVSDRLDPRQELKQSTELAKGLIAQVKELRPILASQLARDLYDKTGGAANLTAASVTATASVGAGTSPTPPPTTDLTHTPYFATPDGNVTCGLPYYRWNAYSPTEPAAVRNNLLCRIAKHTIAPISCSGSGFEAAPGVTKAPGQA